MRIAMVTETWSPCIDGVVVRLENTVRMLRSAGHEVLVLAPTTGTTVVGVDEVRTRSIRLGFLYGGRPWALPDLGALRALDAFRPDVVHLVNPVLMGSVAAWLSRSRYPLVASYHTDVLAYAGHYHLGWLRGPLRSVMRGTYRRADVRLATSELGRRQLAQLGVHSVELWSRGVDRQLFHPDRDGSAMRSRLTPHPEEPLVLYVGRLAPEKGCDRLLPLIGCDPPVHVAFVGDGPDRERLERRFGHEHTTFTGFLSGDDLADAYAAADVLVFPSATDTLGLVLLEAMACGVPVVAADTAAARETLACYPDHVLVDDSDVDIVAGVQHAIARRGPVAALGRAQRVGDWSEATEELVGAYTRAQRPQSARRTGHVGRVGRFAAVGVANAVLDLAVFNLLFFLDPTRSPALLVAYNTCAVIVAIANSYVWNSRWTFRDRPRHGRLDRWRQRTLFAVQGGVNLAVNDLAVLGLSLLLTPVLGLGATTAANASKVLAMLTASAVSYLLMHHVVFARGRSPRPASPGRALQSPRRQETGLDREPAPQRRASEGRTA